MAFNQYSAKEVVLSVFGFNIDGFAEDSMIEVEWSEDTYSTSKGVAGETFMARSGSMSGTVTITLQHNSESNGLLEALLLVSDVSSTAFGGEYQILATLLASGLSIRDGNTGNVISAPAAYLQKTSNMTFDQAGTSRTWILMCPQLLLIPSSGVGKALTILSQLDNSLNANPPS
jgi:hypothetical protein